MWLLSSSSSLTRQPLNTSPHAFLKSSCFYLITPLRIKTGIPPRLPSLTTRASVDDTRDPIPNTPSLLQDELHTKQAIQEVDESVSVLKTAAKTRKVSAEEILAAFSVIEKAKVEPSGFLETLGGTKSPGRTWMLVFTAEKRLKRGRYFPITAVQRFDADVIDRLIQEMNNRFTESSSELLMCIASLSPKDSFSNFDVKRLLRLANLYPDDFSSREKFELNEQLRMFITFVKSSPRFSGLQSIGDLAKTLVETEWHTTYKLVYRLIQLALVLPVTTATVERSFSTMKFIKNDLRNKIGEEYLTDCLVCYIEKDVFVKIENEVIMRRFQSMAPRRQRLPRLNDCPSFAASGSNQN